MRKVKIIANYLPQFHAIPENDKWWGKEYTDWVAVKNAKPLFTGHRQPNVPFNEDYYSLDDKVAIEWQAKIARENNVYGFGIYHYWFSSELKLLEKPAEIILGNRDIDINYMFIWDNSSWKRTWSNVRFANEWAPEYENSGKEANDTGMLAELQYGTEDDWEKHFMYMLPFFQDDRYIKVDNKPLFAFFNQNNKPKILKKMCNYWIELAKKYGFVGMVFIGKRNYEKISIGDYDFNYEPLQHGWSANSYLGRIYNKCQTRFNKFRHRLNRYDYDEIWNKILKDARKCDNSKLLYGGFVGYDDTPRRGINGTLVSGAMSEKFKKYLTELVEISQQQQKEFIFLTAWNEWGEGAYMEPDNESGYKYLESIKDAMQSIEKPE